MGIYEKSFEIVKPRRRWLKRLSCGLWVLLIGGAALLLLALCAWAWRHQLVKRRLHVALAELDLSDPGWRLSDIEMARAQIPEEVNSARVVVAASKFLPKNWPASEFYDRFTHVPPEEQLAAQDFALLKQELNKVLPALAEVRKLAKMTYGRHRIAYKRNVLNTLLDDQHRSRQVIHLLLYSALQCEQENNVNGALIACCAALNAARSLGDEPLAVSQLVRIAGVILACQGIERVLAQGKPAVDDLSAMQMLLAEEDAFQDLLILTRGERAVWHEVFEAMESGDVSIAELADKRPGWNERLFGFVYRDNVRSQHPAMLALMSRLAHIAQLPMAEQSEAEHHVEDDVRELRARYQSLAALPLMGLLKMGDASRRKHAVIRCTIAALAAERYRQTHKNWPDSLDKLCPHFLAGVPLDPFDGEPLRSRRLNDGVIIYSVSSDAVDNGGNLDRERPNQPGADIGVHLWDADKRRQPSKTKPAQPPRTMMPPHR